MIEFASLSLSPTLLLSPPPPLSHTHFSYLWREGKDCNEKEEKELESGGNPVGEEVLEPREDLPRDLDGHDAHAAAGPASVPSRL